MPRSSFLHRHAPRALLTARTLLATVAIPTATFSTLVTTTHTAQAQDSADDLFKKGNVHYASKRWKQAYDAYKAAYALEQSYKIAGNLGDVAVTLGKHREGAEYLSHALRTMPDDKTALKKQVQARLEQAKQEIGTLSITVNVEGAQVACDGRDVGKAPIAGEVFVEAGATSVVVKAEGHKEARRTVALAKGETKAIEITLETDPNAGAVVPAPGAGGNGGASGIEPANGGTGGNGASADANGGVDTDGMSTKTVVLISGAALTAIGVGVGIGFMLDSNSADDDASSNFSKVETTLGKNGCAGNQDAAICKDLTDSLERRDSSKQLSTVGFIGFGVFGAGTLAALLLWPEGKSEGARPLGSQFAFAPTKGGARASFTAQF